ncbi:MULTISPECIES: hypothetical protein [unclassified Burkholderia]|uniref:hypothetical protein n=1 Tax=unclassified Burkholderia TaxID=2613784 RepID=UPI002AB1A8C2|nr:MULTISPECIES: hypothetical protein [unclassified Burkholderia]
MRQIALDTETTGMNPESGHRVIEITRVELLKMGGRHTLDSFCHRVGVNRSHRTLCGARFDADILAEAYLPMTRVRETA